MCGKPSPPCNRSAWTCAAGCERTMFWMNKNCGVFLKRSTPRLAPVEERHSSSPLRFGTARRKGFGFRRNSNNIVVYEAKAWCPLETRCRAARHHPVFDGAAVRQFAGTEIFPAAGVFVSGDDWLRFSRSAAARIGSAPAAWRGRLVPARTRLWHLQRGDSGQDFLPRKKRPDQHVRRLWLRFWHCRAVGHYDQHLARAALAAVSHRGDLLFLSERAGNAVAEPARNDLAFRANAGGGRADVFQPRNGSGRRTLGTFPSYGDLGRNFGVAGHPFAVRAEIRRQRRDA